MKRIALIALIALAALSGTATAKDSGRSPHFEGSIVSVDRAGKSFRIRDVERGTVRVYVNSRTVYQRISGFSGIKAGLSGVEAKVRKSGGRWVAWKVER
jgi:hypothetical protein